MSEVKSLHEPFAKWLRAEGIPFIRARSDRESTIAEGCQDFSLLLGGKCLAIEFKWKDGKLSPKQREWIAAMERSGTKVYVLRDISSAIELVTAWKATLGPVQAVDAPRRETTIYGGKRYTITEDNQLVDPRPI